MELRRVIYYYGEEEVLRWFQDYDVSKYLTSEQIQVMLQNSVWSKEELAKKIVDHYYMQEIGFETPALFKHYAKVKMQEIMESKLPLIYSLALQYNPLVNYNVSENITRDFDETKNQTINNSTNDDFASSSSTSNSTNATTSSNGTTTSNSSGSGSSLKVASDTPQGQISKAGILAGDYATSTEANENTTQATDSTENYNTGSGSSTDTGTESSENHRQKRDSTTNANINAQDETIIKTKSGNISSYSKLIKEFRENIVSIDKDIIESLNVLFMGLY